jgi:PAS domain S-box-containing protein
VRDEDRTKEQLINELLEMRMRLAELEKGQIQRQLTRPDELGAVARGESERARSIPESHAAADISEQEQTPEKVLSFPLKGLITPNSVSDAICLLDMEDTVLDCNEAMLELLGKPGSEVIGNPCCKLVHGTSGSIDGCPVVRMRKTRTRETMELPVGDRWFDVSADPVVDEAGDLIGALHILSDITKRRRAEEALRRSEEKYRELVQNANSIILRMDKSGNITFFNEFAERFFGYRESEILGKSVVGTIVPEVESTGRDLRAMIEDIGINPDHYINNINENMCCNKEKVWVAWTNRPILDDNGHVLELLCIGNDITERKRAEQALQELQQQLADIIDFLPDATLVIDLQGTVIAWNRAMEELTGIGKEDAVGRGKDAFAIAVYGRPRPLLVDLVLDSDLRFQNLYDHVEQRGNTLYAEVRVPEIHNRRSWHIWATASPLFDRNGRVIGAIESARDITDHKEMEETLREREKELETKSLDLQEKNTALKVLLKHREEDQKEFGVNILSNLKELVFPYLEKLKNSPLNEMQRTHMSILEAHLEEIGAPFLRRLASEFANLSPMERQIASLIRDGKRNKEISEILGVSPNTISTHRYHLRTKLGLKHKHINLVSYLQSESTI